MYNQVNQNQQSFYTAGYRGNQPGHDNYLRSDSSQPTNIGYQSSNSFVTQTGYGTPVTSQYKGMQRTFQPTGYVQSVYGQSGQSFGSQYQSQYQSQFTSPASYQTANYRGNQPGHDNYLRADSTQPTNYSNFSNQSSFTGSQSSYTNQFQPIQSNQSFSGSIQNTQFQYRPNQQQQQQQFTQQYQSTNSYHLPNYQGNQPGHDNYLRSDSQQPNQFSRNSF